MDLSFMLNKQQLINLKNKVIDELYSWNGMLDALDEDTYYKLIAQIQVLIDNLK